jgi:hypothetical protein
MEIPDHPFNMTQGVVLDPFSILVSGILRRNGNVRKTESRTMTSIGCMVRRGSSKRSSTPATSRSR